MELELGVSKFSACEVSFVSRTHGKPSSNGLFIRNKWDHSTASFVCFLCCVESNCQRSTYSRAYIHSCLTTQFRKLSSGADMQRDQDTQIARCEVDRQRSRNMWLANIVLEP